jgi:hypothetical protein
MKVVSEQLATFLFFMRFSLLANVKFMILQVGAQVIFLICTIRNHHITLYFLY